jgi:hypothetical protein
MIHIMYTAQVQGAVTVPNSDFETIGGGGADVFASWAETVSGSSTITVETTSVSTGTKSCALNIDSSNSLAQISSPGILTVGSLYRCIFNARASATGAVLIVGRNTGGVGVALSTTWQSYTMDFVADTTGLIIKRSNSTSKTMYIDTVSLFLLG